MDEAPNFGDRAMALTEAELREIDAALMSNTHPSYRKVAMIVGTTMLHFQGRFRGVPDTFFAYRLRTLVLSGQLESTGDVSRMRYVEVRRTE